MDCYHRFQMIKMKKIRKNKIFFNEQLESTED